MKSIYIRAHAQRQLKERNISESLVREVLSHPDEIIKSHGGRLIAQKIINYSGEKFLARVVYEENDKKAIITVYLTTKIEKYRR